MNASFLSIFGVSSFLLLAYMWASIAKGCIFNLLSVQEIENYFVHLKELILLKNNICFKQIFDH